MSRSLDDVDDDDEEELLEDEEEDDDDEDELDDSLLEYERSRLFAMLFMFDSTIATASRSLSSWSLLKSTLLTAIKPASSSTKTSFSIINFLSMQIEKV